MHLTDPADSAALISDRDIDRLAEAETIFRRHWAIDLGHDPDATDLDALPAQRAA